MATTGNPEVDTAISTANQILSSLPDGQLKTTLQKALSSMGITTIIKWISGYKYTSGDYALGEIFLNRVLNKQTSSRWDTPDAIVPLAWYYFTGLFGIPIAVNTDLDWLAAHDDLEGYYQQRPEQRGYITQAQVTRAHQLINMPQMQLSNKYGQWPPDIFSLVPYVAPIPDARLAGQLFTGTFPNGQQFVNGVPTTNATKGANINVSSGSSAYLYIGAVLLIIIIILLII